MNILLEQAVSYCKKIIGNGPIIKPFDQAKKIPLHLREMYDFYSGKLLGKRLIILVEKPGNRSTPAQMKKHETIVQDIFNDPAVFVLPQLEAFNRNRLINYKIPFIVAGKQMYLPHLMIDLRESFNATKKQRNYFMPSAQLLILYHLQKESLEGKSLDELSNSLEYSSMSMSRAVGQIANFGLAEVKEGKRKPLVFNIRGKELWEKAQPFLRSPVINTFYLSGKWAADSFLISNINALAHYTDISESMRPYYACYGSTFQRLKLNKRITEGPQDDISPAIEVWRYDPFVLKTGKTVDPLSLYLSMKDTNDERVENALGKLIDEVVKW